ncbi:unnamed protein product [Polarella glacialis]|uniref:Pseudouridine synthase RsuA/RluA-like domain-containing protein n=1 Tax=Polarella glacialis TaxID=89957 RepID=A0A813GRI0_POLGL|nr:unnamed protein product [Polarella glacialis]CAE8696358.1 unnamed protein product [Polarella glacialis]
MSGLARASVWELAISCLCEALQHDLKADAFHFGAAIAACSRRGQWLSALQLLSQMRTLRIEVSTIACSSGVTACEKSGHWPVALALCMDMAAGSIRLDTIICSSAVSACAKGGQWLAALSLFEGMAALRIERNTISYNAAIDACSREGNWLVALGLLKSMSETKTLPSTVSFGAAIHSCSVAGEWQSACDLLERMVSAKVERSTTSFNAAISSCEKEPGHWLVALKLLRATAFASVELDVITFNSATSACASGSQWALALTLCSNVASRGIRRNHITYGAAISSCAKSALWSAATKLLGEMSIVLVEKNIISYSSAISACGNAGNWVAACFLLSEMASTRLERNHIAFCSTINACGKGLQWSRALGLLQEMVETSLEISAFSLTAALNACEPEGKWEEAMDVLKTMKWCRVIPDGIQAGSAANSIRKALGKGPAIALLQDLRQDWIDEDRCPLHSSAQHISEFVAAVGLGGPNQVHDQRIPVIFQGLGVVAISKPAGISSQRALALLSSALGRPLTAVSRLDLPTSGVLPAALGHEGSEAAFWLQAQFAGRLVSKEYLCLCHGAVDEGVGSEGKISSRLQVVASSESSSRVEVSPLGREACTHYKVLSTYQAPTPAQDFRNELSGRERPTMLSLLRVWPLTGRTHQIRAHLSSIGLPLVGDMLYRGLTVESECSQDEAMEACSELDNDEEKLERKFEEDTNVGTGGGHVEEPVSHLLGRPAPSTSDWCPRLFLHCQRLQLLGLDGKPITLEAALPAELSKALAGLTLLDSITQTRSYQRPPGAFLLTRNLRGSVPQTRS